MNTYIHYPSKKGIDLGIRPPPAPPLSNVEGGGRRIECEYTFFWTSINIGYGGAGGGRTFV